MLSLILLKLAKYRTFWISIVIYSILLIPLTFAGGAFMVALVEVCALLSVSSLGCFMCCSLLEAVSLTVQDSAGTVLSLIHI